MTHLESIVLQLWKWDRKGLLKNRPKPELAPLSKGPVPPLVSIRTRGGEEVLLDAESITVVDGQDLVGRVRYAELSHVHWMSRDLDEKVRLKKTSDFDRLLLEYVDQDGTSAELLLVGLGQAVFPLLSAFLRIAARKTIAG